MIDQDRDSALAIVKLFKDRKVEAAGTLESRVLSDGIKDEKAREAGVRYGLQHGWFEVTDDAKSAYRLKEIGFAQEREMHDPAARSGKGPSPSPARKPDNTDKATKGRH